MATSVVGMDQTDLAEIPTTPGHKRKRASESASPDSRRNKRSAPPSTMAVPDADGQSFLDNTVSIAQAAQDHVQLDDFSALQQATADHNDGPDATAASSTAAAVLNNMYPTLHVPQTTEETFAAQAVPDPHHDENAYSAPPPVSLPDGLPVVSAVPMQPPNGLPQVPQVPQDQRYGGPSNPKPAVGSEEWHKMRKDNHKEGLCLLAEAETAWSIV